MTTLFARFRRAQRPLRGLCAFVAAMLAASATIPPCAFADAQEAPQTSPPSILRGVVTGDRAYLPAAPEMIAAARARFIPQPTGRYVLIVRDEEALPPGPDTGKATTGGSALLLYDSVAHRTRTLWEQPAAHGTRVGTVVEAQWLPGVDCAVATVDTQVVDGGSATSNKIPSTMSLLFVDAARDGRARTLLSSEETISLTISPPGLPTRVAVQVSSVDEPAVGDSVDSTLYFLDTRGRLGAPILLRGNGDAMRGRLFPSGWNENGSVFYLRGYDVIPQTPPAPPRMVSHWFSVTVATGQIAALTERPKRSATAQAVSPPATRPLPLRLITRRMALPDANGKPSASGLASLWLDAVERTAASPPAQFIAPDADEYTVLPDLSAILYTTQKAVYAVPLVSLPAAQYRVANAEALRLRAMQQAKQIGLGALMYSQDYDEQFPPSEGVTNSLNPYIKNSDVFNDPTTGSTGFVYLLNGDKLGTIGSPADTRLGYLPGPGGKAVVYADGHVKWEEDGPQKPPR